MKKSISTELTPANIAHVLDMLAATPLALRHLSEGLHDDDTRRPLGEGERSLVEVVAHLLNSEALTADSIYAALLIDEPLIADLHPERDWGRLLRLAQHPLTALMEYFSFRRTLLLNVLNAITPAQWERVVREPNKQRKESVYWRSRSLALHEQEHLQHLTLKISTIIPQTVIRS